MIRRRILLINLLNRSQRFDSDARHLTLKDTDHTSYIFKYMQLKIVQCIFWTKMYAIQGPIVVNEK